MRLENSLQDGIFGFSMLNVSSYPTRSFLQVTANFPSNIVLQEWEEALTKQTSFIIHLVSMPIKIKPPTSLISTITVLLNTSRTQWVAKSCQVEMEKEIELINWTIQGL